MYHIQDRSAGKISEQEFKHWPKCFSACMLCNQRLKLQQTKKQNYCASQRLFPVSGDFLWLSTNFIVSFGNDES